ncbi:E3 SUMO-protein ligase KIAA1586-like [Aphis gossypii]|uniref:E3 SUMO-protein ligase KIAA1586-like n=1 Tax=Aphis gossypii TaxID=80765 RepID=UPI0021597AB5|nr:E3 SUMO-protein ligase KIAA1586-like [Aphis gossypii]
MEKFLTKTTKTKVGQTIEISLDKPNIVKTIKNSDDEDDPSPVAKKKSKMDNKSTHPLISEDDQNLKQMCDTINCITKSSVPWPSDWSYDQWIEKKNKYPWLIYSDGKIGCEYCKSVDTLKTFKSKGVSKAFQTGQSNFYETTQTIFRTAYYIAKYNRPYDDHSKLIELQHLNGLNLDESTTVSSLSGMVVYVKSSILNSEPIFIFLDLVELKSQTASSIVSQLIECLYASGFFGRTLELAVGDTLKDITATNHFKHFLDSLYSLYSRSPKNQIELKEHCTSLNDIFLKIGKVLDVRWVASSFRTISVIWKIYPALYNHLIQASQNKFRDETVKAKEKMIFKTVVLSNNEKITCINKNQFITSVVNNLNMRLIPNEGMRIYIDDNDNNDITLIEELNDINILIKTFPCSTAECERGFSVMNNICTDLRSRLLINNISNSMFININGPPLQRWNPKDYVESWLTSHRDADDNKSRKVNTSTATEDPKYKLWQLL